MAGKRKGTDDERYLWHEMLRAIQEIKPKFVIAENVFGITNIDGGLVFEQVCLDLETEGYEVQPFIIPAAAKNAPHRRDRVWFIAQNTNCIGLDDRKTNSGTGRNREFESTSSIREIDETHRNATDTKGIRPIQRNTIAIGELPKRNGFEALYQSTNWRKFPTQSPICGGDDGLPTELDGITFSKWRQESIKGYGNAIVPQVALELFKVIESINNEF